MTINKTIISESNNFKLIKFKTKRKNKYRVKPRRTVYVVSDFFDRPEYYYEQLDSGCDVSFQYSIEFFRIIGEDPRPVLLMGKSISVIDFWSFNTKEEAENRYGLSGDFCFDTEKVGVIIADTVDAANIAPGLDLFQERLQKLTEYDSSQFDAFRIKTVGKLKIHSDDIMNSIKGVESVTGDRTVEPNDLFTRSDYRHSLERTVSAAAAGTAVQQLAAALLESENTSCTAYGENPFPLIRK